jgi:hypothetical protein
MPSLAFCRHVCAMRRFSYTALLQLTLDVTHFDYIFHGVVKPQGAVGTTGMGCGFCTAGSGFKW